MDNPNQTPEQQEARTELLDDLRSVITGGTSNSGTERIQAALLIARLEKVLTRSELAELAHVVKGPNPKK